MLEMMRGTSSRAGCAPLGYLKCGENKICSISHRSKNSYLSGF